MSFIEDLKKLQGFKKAYIQRLEGQFVNDASFYYWNGLKSLKIPIEFFDEDKKYDINLDRETLVVAGVPTTIKVFETLGIKIPKPLDIPEELVSFCGRRVEITTIREAIKKTKQDFPLFVKPSEHGKLFNGQTVSGVEELELFRYCSEEFDLDLPVLISEPVNFISEYRSFVLEGKILDSRRYMGDFKIFPDFSIIEKAVSSYTKSPIAYAIDFGVTDDGRTLLVECNDAYSLGPYGFDNFNLTRMFIMRWKELLADKLIFTNR